MRKKSNKDALAILTEGFATINDIEPNLSIEYNISKTNLPILFTEGITDKIILEAAWGKLNPETEMPFFIQDCFDASFLANLFRRGLDEKDGVFTTNPNKILVSLFDFDTEGYNSWNGLSKFSEHLETNPKKGLLRKLPGKSGFSLLLPVPNNPNIEKQVIKDGNETFKSKAILSIELFFYGNFDLERYFKKETIQGGGEIIVFHGKKRDFAIKAKEFNKDKFVNFIPLFSKLNDIFKQT